MELNFCLIIIINIGTKSLSKRASPSIHGEYIDDPACIWFGKLLAFTKMSFSGYKKFKFRYFAIAGSKFAIIKLTSYKIFTNLEMITYYYYFTS